MAVKTVGYLPNVDQTFGGTFSTTTPPPGRTSRSASAEPAVDRETQHRRSPANKPRGRGSRPEHAEPILPLCGGIGRRFGGLTPCATSI